MILRDQHGEVEARLGDLFEYKGAIFSVLFEERGLMINGQSAIFARLKKGHYIAHGGRRFEAEFPDQPMSPAGYPIQPVVLFPADLVASCVREHRLMTFDIPDDSLRTGQSADKDNRAPAKQKGAGQNPPNPSLFD